jgi:allophanate hydrolase
MNSSETFIDIVVCGAHMQGLPLNTQLTERGALFKAAVKTAPCYQLYALPGGPPFRPGLVRVIEHGVSIDAEIWRLPATRWGDFIALIPAPLAIGTLELSDGKRIKGFMCEAYAVQGARNISAIGSWRTFLKTL